MLQLARWIGFGVSLFFMSSFAHAELPLNVLESGFVASKYADRELHFKHQE